MILDSMNKFEVMRAIRKDFDEDVLPFYNSSLRLKIRLMIKDRASRLKSVINLGWTEYISRNKIKYHILQKGDQYGDTPLFISECIWKKRNGKPQTIFATLHPNSAIAIYTQHCLERYAERVIFQPSRPLKDILNDLLKQQKFAFHIVLPSPTHKFTVYHSFANALFLGDYDPPKDSNSPSWNWYNNCISLNES